MLQEIQRIIEFLNEDVDDDDDDEIYAKPQFAIITTIQKGKVMPTFLLHGLTHRQTDFNICK